MQKRYGEKSFVISVNSNYTEWLLSHYGCQIRKLIWILIIKEQFTVTLFMTVSNAILIKLRIHYKKRNIMEMKTLTTIWSVSVPKCYGDTRFFTNNAFYQQCLSVA